MEDFLVGAMKWDDYWQTAFIKNGKCNMDSLGINMKKYLLWNIPDKMTRENIHWGCFKRYAEFWILR